MRRRALLASGIVLLPIGGCLSAAPGGSGGAGSNGAAEIPTASLSMEAVEDAEIPARMLHTLTPDGSGTRTPESELVDRAEREGSATVDRIRPPLPEDRPLVYGETVYRLAYEVTGETSATRFSVKVDVVNGDERDGRTVRFEDLPAVDREVFDRNGLASGEVVGVGTTLLYTESEVERSVLVPETDVSVIEWDSGNQAEWVVDDAHGTTLKTYRYTVEGTTSASEYGREVRERFVWTLSGLDDDERGIVEAAIEDRYVVHPDETPSPAVVSLVERFRPHDRVEESKSEYRDGVSGPYLLGYDADLYWTRLTVRSSAFGTETPA
ncbi:MAG: hypothetical protein V5A62_00780 [Haloarculaceae archaeon]